MRTDEGAPVEHVLLGDGLGLRFARRAPNPQYTERLQRTLEHAWRALDELRDAPPTSFKGALETVIKELEFTLKCRERWGNEP